MYAREGRGRMTADDLDGDPLTRENVNATIQGMVDQRVVTTMAGGQRP
jgi:hypothetical protein